MKLPKIYRPLKNSKLVRIGNKNDGGYLIGLKSIRDSEHLISFGISDDWSFELDVLSKNSKIKIESFDDSLSKKFLIKKIFNSFTQMLHLNFKFNQIIKSCINLFMFPIIKKRINLKKKYVTNSDLIKISQHKDKILLKIDIEGSEYRILEDIISIKDSLNALIIEFHDIDLHKDKIVDFIKRIQLNLTHIHPNNFSNADKYGNPTVIEITLERYPEFTSEKINLPHPLDMKCDLNSKDYKLHFED